MIHTRAVGKAAKLISVCGTRFSLTNVRPLACPHQETGWGPVSHRDSSKSPWTQPRGPISAGRQPTPPSTASVAASTPKNAGGEVCLAPSTSLPGPERCRKPHRRCQCERSAPRVMTTGTIGSLARTRRTSAPPDVENQYIWGAGRGGLQPDDLEEGEGGGGVCGKPHYLPDWATRCATPKRRAGLQSRTGQMRGGRRGAEGSPPDRSRLSCAANLELARWQLVAAGVTPAIQKRARRLMASKLARPPRRR